MDASPAHGQYTLRKAMPSDNDFVFALHAECFRDMSVESFGGWDPDHAKQRIAFMIEEGASIIQVGGEDAGFFRCFASAPGWIELAELELLPAFRGRGIGTRILADLNQFADANQFQLELQVLVTNPAQALYEHMGFVTTHRKMSRRPNKAE